MYGQQNIKKKKLMMMVGDKRRTYQKHKSLSLRDLLSVHRSPFVSCFVYNKDEVKIACSSDHREHCTESNRIISHAK